MTHAHETFYQITTTQEQSSYWAIKTIQCHWECCLLITADQQRPSLVRRTSHVSRTLALSSYLRYAARLYTAQAYNELSLCLTFTRTLTLCNRIYCSFICTLYMSWGTSGVKPPPTTLETATLEHLITGATGHTYAPCSLLWRRRMTFKNTTERPFLDSVRGEVYSSQYHMPFNTNSLAMFVKTHSMCSV